MGCGINSETSVKLRGNSDIETAFICNFRFFCFRCTHFQIVINSIVKTINKLRCAFSFIRNQRTDSHDFTIKKPVFFGKVV